jgi:ATP-dependent RNA helicase RhlE
LAKSGTPLEKIEQTAYKVENFNTKINLLENLLKNDTDMSKVLIFNNNKKMQICYLQKLMSFSLNSLT